MKRRSMFILGCMIITLALVGCGSGSDSNSNKSPSADVFPFGVASMNFEFDEILNTASELIYDNQGRVVEINTTSEMKRDGRVEAIITASYTIDPTLAPMDLTELENTDSRAMPAAVTIQGLALDTLALSETFSLLTEETLTPQARRELPFFIGLPGFLNYLPGAVVNVEINVYSYNVWGIRSAPIPDEMVKLLQLTVSFAYEQDGRPSKIAASVETSEFSITQTITCTYENGRIVRTMYVQRADYNHDGWIDENRVTEVKFTYDEDGRLIRKTVKDLSGYRDFAVTAESYDSVTTYFYNASGSLIETVETAGNYMYTTTYTYDEMGRTLTKTYIEAPDDDPDQEIERWTHTYTYGAFGPTSYLFESVASGSETGRSYTYAYDEHGRLVHRVMSENGADGPDAFEINSWAYDESGRLERIVETTHDADGDNPGPATYTGTTAFSYDLQGRLTQVSYESALDEKDSVIYVYDEAGKGAAGTLQQFRWDESGAFIEDGPEELLGFTFISGVPTAAMGMPIDDYPLGYSSDWRLEMPPVTVKVPAMYSLSFFAEEMGWGMIR